MIIIIYLIKHLFFLCFRFINARRRIVQPMIDQSNRAGEFSKSLLRVVIWMFYCTVCVFFLQNIEIYYYSMKTYYFDLNNSR